MGNDGSGGNVRVYYVGMVRRAVGTNVDCVRLDGAATLGLLLGLLADRYGAAFRNHVFDGRELSRASNVFIDGLNCRSLGGLDAPLDGAREVEVIVFGPPAMGG